MSETAKSAEKSFRRLMFIHKTQVRLQDTDATGVLYFAQQFKMALEAFEEFLQARGFSWRQLLSSDYLMPVVHAEGDYLAPVMVGDTLNICLEVVRVGDSSFTLGYTLHDVDRKIDVGKVQIVHVVVDRQKRSAVPIPPFFREILNIPAAGME